MLDSSVKHCYGCGSEIIEDICKYCGRHVNSVIQLQNNILSSDEIDAVESFRKDIREIVNSELIFSEDISSGCIVEPQFAIYNSPYESSPAQEVYVKKEKRNFSDRFKFKQRKEGDGKPPENDFDMKRQNYIDQIARIKERMYEKRMTTPYSIISEFEDSNDRDHIRYLENSLEDLDRYENNSIRRF